MARQKKDGEHINLYIDRSVVQRLRKYADEKGQTVTMALEQILADFFKKEDESSEMDNKEA